MDLYKNQKKKKQENRNLRKIIIFKFLATNNMIDVGMKRYYKMNI